MSNTSNSLMRKTKVELVDIILRKDDVERKLRENLAITYAEVEAANKDLDELKKHAEDNYAAKLEAVNTSKELVKALDELQVANANLEVKLSGFNRWCKELTIATIFFAVLAAALGICIIL